jgi:hypothetical protein
MPLWYRTLQADGRASCFTCAVVRPSFWPFSRFLSHPKNSAPRTYLLIAYPKNSVTISTLPFKVISVFVAVTV